MQARCFRYFCRTVFLVLFFVATAACSHGQAPAGPQQLVYVTIPEKRTIAVFSSDVGEATRPLAKIVEDSPDQPVDVSADLLREVFVANGNGNVKAYSAHNARFARIHLLEGPNTKIVHPQAITVDIAGSFFVADAGETPGHGRVEWFPGGLNGNVPPNRVIDGPHTGITNPTGLALDGSGRLYVADRNSNKVLIFDADANGDVPPAATIGPFKAPRRVFVDQLLNVYVSNEGDHTVSVFQNEGPESWGLATTLSAGVLHDPQGVAADSAGRIAVAASDGILFFAPSAKNAAPPIAVLSLGAKIRPMGLYIR
jgi:DNA-binding beta-propeller fold protein YncE